MSNDKSPNNEIIETPEESAEENLESPEEDLAELSFTTLFFDYLNSRKGHEIAKNVLKFLEELKIATIDSNTKQIESQSLQSMIDSQNLDRLRRQFLIIQSIVAIGSIVALALLTYFGKLDPTVAVLIGTIVGYYFGKKPS